MTSASPTGTPSILRFFYSASCCLAAIVIWASLIFLTYYNHDRPDDAPPLSIWSILISAPLLLLIGGLVIASLYGRDRWGAWRWFPLLALASNAATIWALKADDDSAYAIPDSVHTGLFLGALLALAVGTSFAASERKVDTP